jgi:hypothetical protein
MNKPESAYRVRDTSVTDTDELLLAAGLSEREIGEMRNQGVVA